MWLRMQWPWNKYTLHIWTMESLCHCIVSWHIPVVILCLLEGGDPEWTVPVVNMNATYHLCTQSSLSSRLSNHLVFDCLQYVYGWHDGSRQTTHMRTCTYTPMHTHLHTPVSPWEYLPLLLILAQSLGSKFLIRGFFHYILCTLSVSYFFLCLFPILPLSTVYFCIIQTCKLKYNLWH